MTSPNDSLDAKYWNNRYLQGNTPWDTGGPTPPLVSIFQTITQRDAAILIPGAGNAHEAIYLHEHGFNNVWVCDWAEAAIASFAEAHPDFPKHHLICSDFFLLEQKFDHIIEQTFFCALPPQLCPQYVKKTAALLHNEGCIQGVLFAHPFPFEGPPFGGTADEYRSLFSPVFHIDILEPCSNSIPPRAGNELICKFRKR